MKTASLFCLLATLLYSQPRKVLFTGNSEIHGVRLGFETVLENAGEADPFWAQDHGGGFRNTAGREHRFLWDEATHTYFGYDLVVERAVERGSCRVSISPLSMTLDVLMEWPRQPVPGEYSGYKLLSLPTNPGEQIVRSGDTIAVDLLASPDGKRRVVDYIKIMGVAPAIFNWTPAVGGGVPPEPTPRDFTAEDLALRLVRPQFSVNGKAIDSAGGETTGSVLWFYLPGRGRFLVSLIPYPNFVKTGTLRGSLISFRSGADTYEVHSAEPYLRSWHPLWNLYVLAQPSYRKGQAILFGGVDRPDRFVP